MRYQMTVSLDIFTSAPDLDTARGMLVREAQTLQRQLSGNPNLRIRAINGESARRAD